MGSVAITKDGVCSTPKECVNLRLEKVSSVDNQRFIINNIKETTKGTTYYSYIIEDEILNFRL